MNGARRAAVLFGRALLLRCPACAAGGIVASWTRFEDVCPGCGLILERDDGYFTGAVWLNLTVAQLGWALSLVAALVLTWPSPPWNAILWGSVALMVLLPVLFFPFSKTVWLALDLLFRPVERSEFWRHRYANH